MTSDFKLGEIAEFRVVNSKWDPDTERVVVPRSGKESNLFSLILVNTSSGPLNMEVIYEEYKVGTFRVESQTWCKLEKYSDSPMHLALYSENSPQYHKVSDFARGKLQVTAVEIIQGSFVDDVQPFTGKSSEFDITRTAEEIDATRVGMTVQLVLEPTASSPVPEER